jgi:isoquinoline 1-oxidoreductase subunit beta
MENIKTKYNRRSFLKSSALAGGGLMLTASWFASAKAADKMEALNLPEQWNELTGYIKITPDNVVTILCPNPEFGQNVMTSLPMILAEELDVDWKNVVVEMGPHDNVKLGPQFSGGSNSVRMYWKPLREAGAAARQMLCEAAAQTWGVPVAEVTTQGGVLRHASGKSAKYGEMASKAATLPVPKGMKLKAQKDFAIVSKSQKNVAGKKIVTGQPLFGIEL